jgi:ASC-1-like (ASCH) protein
MNENPVDYLIRRLGMSKLAFTRKYGLGENHLLLVSQGRKESVSLGLIEVLTQEATEKGLPLRQTLDEEYGTGNLNEAYQTWIKHARSETDLRVRIPNQREVSPWASIVAQIGSVSATSKLLKVRFIAVRKYLTTPEMPAPIREALEDIGWTGITRLDRAQHRFFEAEVAEQASA